LKKLDRQLRSSVTALAGSTGDLPADASFYRALLETCRDAMVVTDLDTRIVFANARAAELWGATDARELIGRDCLELIVAENRAKATANVQGLIHGGVLDDLESTIVRADGRRIHTQTSVALLKADTGEPAGLLAIARDVTPRWEAEAALTTRDANLRLFMESAPDGIVVTDPKGRCVLISTAAATTLGYEPDELLGRSLRHVIRFGHADGSPYSEEDCPVGQTARTGQRLHHDDAVLWRKDGTFVPVEYASYPMLENGEISGVLLTYRDSTRLKRLAREQSGVVELGWLALTGSDVAEVMRLAVQLVVRTLAIEGAALLELLPDRSVFTVRAVVGACGGRVVDTPVEAGVDSKLPTAGTGGGPVPVALYGHHGPFGVLEAYAASGRSFADDEVRFLEAVANVVAAAVERKRAESVLHHREQEFKALVENAPDIIARFDRRLRPVYLNLAGERAIGVPADTIAGRTPGELGIPQLFLNSWQLTLERVFSTGDEQVIEVPLETTLGTRSYHARLSPEFGDHDTVDSVLLIARDITERKQAEEERQHVYTELVARESRLQELVERILRRQGDTVPVARPLRDIEPLTPLTPREHQILCLVAEGRTNKAIGSALGLSPGTVKNHITRLLPKLGATDRTHAAVRAAEAGLLTRQQ
jgi:PAS domain S-box-containing protein